jgi:hypothetical protein
MNVKNVVHTQQRVRVEARSLLGDKHIARSRVFVHLLQRLFSLYTNEVSRKQHSGIYSRDYSVSILMRYPESSILVGCSCIVLIGCAIQTLEV